MLRSAVRTTAAWARPLAARPAVAQHRGFAAAATSAQKRALNQDQLKGSGTPPPTPPPSSSSSPLPILLGGAVLVGAGVAYSQGLIPGLEAHPEEAREQAEVVAKEEASASEKEAPAAESSSTVLGKEEKVEKETPAVVEKEAPATAQGNRVLKISLPAGKQRSTAAAATTEHPTGGNRVSMAPAKAEPQEEAPSVDRALQELQGSFSNESSLALQQARKELAQLSAVSLADLESMTPAQLKVRLIQVAKELEDRTKWEAVRLKEFLAMKEKEVQEEYLILMKKQRLEAESALEQKIKEQEYDLTTKAERALQEKEQALQGIIDHSLKIQEQQFLDEQANFEAKTKEALQAQYEEMLAKQVTELKQSFAQKMEQKVQQIQKLSQQLSDLEFSLQNTQTFQTGSVQAHRMSAAALALMDTLESSKPAAAAMQALKGVAQENAVISSALEALPSTAATSGIPTLQELQTKFEEQVYAKCRQSALVPSGQQGLEGQLLGWAFSTLKFPPGPDDPAPESEKDEAEYVLARARKHVQLGELEQAVEQMSKLKGQAGFVAKDWTQMAQERVAVDKALKVIKVECALANESMSQIPPKE